MTSPARRHFERVSVALAAADAGEAPMQGEAYELMQAALFEDYRLLKSTQSMERKAEIKREILPKYADYVDGALEAGQGAQDDVLMTVMLSHNIDEHGALKAIRAEAMKKQQIKFNQKDCGDDAE